MLTVSATLVLQKKFNEMMSNQIFYPNQKLHAKPKSVTKFNSFEDMENDQLNYFASLEAEELLQNLKQMVLTTFGFREEPSFDSLPRIIQFNKEPRISF